MITKCDAIKGIIEKDGVGQQVYCNESIPYQPILHPLMHTTKYVIEQKTIRDYTPYNFFRQINSVKINQRKTKQRKNRKTVTVMINF